MTQRKFNLMLLGSCLAALALVMFGFWAGRRSQRQEDADLAALCVDRIRFAQRVVDTYHTKTAEVDRLLEQLNTGLKVLKEEFQDQGLLWPPKPIPDPGV